MKLLIPTAVALPFLCMVGSLAPAAPTDLPRSSLLDKLGPSDALFPRPADAPLLFAPLDPDPYPIEDRPPTPTPSPSDAPYAPVVTRGGGVAAESPLVRTARRVAPAVLAITAWDEYGSPLATTTGFFVSSSGLVITDPSIVHPQLGTRIAYVTATSGTKKHYRISGVWERDLTAGYALLQTAQQEVPHLAVSVREPVSTKTRVTVLGLDPERGLILADGDASPDSGRSGDGWLRVEGEDAPGAVGSPMFGHDGTVLGLISMSLSFERWVSYAVPLASIRASLSKKSKATLTSIEGLDGRGYRPITEDKAFVTAVQELYEGSPRKALRRLLDLRRRYPRSAEIWAVLGVAWHKAGEIEEATACYQRAVALDPSKGAYWNQLALSQASAGESVEDGGATIASLERALEANPGQRVATRLLAERYIESGRFREAADTLTDLIKLRPGNANAHYLLGHAQAKLGDYRASEAAVLECLKRDRRHANAWFYLGMLKDLSGDSKGSLDAYRNAARNNPAHPKVWLNLAAAYRAAGNGPAAREAMANHFEITDRREGRL